MWIVRGSERERTGRGRSAYIHGGAGGGNSSAVEEAVDEEPGDAEGDEHGEEEESEHQAPGWSIVVGWG
jgi:hypothetical protein